MARDIYINIIGDAYLDQGEKINAGRLIKIKVKNKKMKTIGVEIIFSIKL